MNGDLSRVTFDPLKHFTRVVTQQGRVQMDADANEQVAILLHYLRALAADLIGQHGGPDDSFSNLANRTGVIKRNCGFGIIAARKSGGAVTYFPSAQALSEDEKQMMQEMSTNNQLPLRITRGHYYVDGLLCESDDYWRYSQQPDLEQANDDRIKKLSNGTYLLYLDVWERHVTALEEPSIREVALGGADTSARTKLVWQIRVRPEPLAPPPADCKAFDPLWVEIMNRLKPSNRGSMQADAKKDTETDSDDPCVSSPEARFRGRENQLYRVEIHKGGPALNKQGTNRDDAATFKWSRDNGTVVAAVKRKRGDELIVSGLRDFSRWFSQDNWVEITHDALELNGVPGTMARVLQVDGESLTIDPNTASGKIYEPQSKYKDMPVRNLKVRRWDHRQLEDEPLRGGAVLLEEDEWMELEDGISIRFEPPAQGGAATVYRTGDYWLIPARVSTGDVEWPTREVPDPNNANDNITEPKGLPPKGVEHHYAPLAAITLAGGEITAVLDLRHKFRASGAC